MVNRNPERFVEQGYCLFPNLFDDTEVVSNRRLLDEYTDVQGNESNDPLKLINKGDYGFGVNNKLLEAFEKREEERSLFWVLGTSLIFEAILLFWAGLKFSRKDF